MIHLVVFLVELDSCHLVSGHFGVNWSSELVLESNKHCNWNSVNLVQWDDRNILSSVVLDVQRISTPIVLLESGLGEQLAVVDVLSD
jgi:hypothetical protein